MKRCYPVSDTKPEVHELVTERALKHIAYRVRDFHNDPTVDILSEARHIRSLFHISNVSIELDPAPLISVSCYVGDDGKRDTVRIGMGGWLVLRPNTAQPMHPLDHSACWMRDLSGRIMFYSDDKFRERYELNV